MYHDSALNQATSSASVVAVMASLTPQNNLNPRKTHARSGFTSRSLSQLPRFQDCYNPPQFQDTSAAKDEMMALLRTRSRSTTSSSAKSSTDSSHSPLVFSTTSSLTSTPSTSPRKVPAQYCSPTPAGNASVDMSIDTSLPSTNTLSPRARRILMRSARKVGNILGETPVLCTTPDVSDARLGMPASSELGVLPSSSSPPAASSSGLKKMNSLNTQLRPRPRAEMGFGMYDGLASGFVAPHQYTDLSVNLAPTMSAPLPSRVPPMLKVDCALVTATGKRARQGSSAEVTPDADARSFISTTTTTSTMANDLFSPSTSRRSPISPIGTGLGYTGRAKDKAREVRRSKVAKLSRHLGEHVPAELVFPSETEPYVLVSYKDASPVSPLMDTKPKGDVIQPPARTSSLRRRKRKSLQLDLARSPSTPSSTPSTNSSNPMSPIGAASSKYRPVRALSRSHSVRSRGRKISTPAISRSSASTESDNTRTHPASAPAIQVVHETGDETGLDQEKDKDKDLEPRMLLSDAQKAINVRRAQKMVSVFGEAPPNALLPGKVTCESPGALSRAAFGGARFKRHSISSIMTSTLSYIEIREPATFDSPMATPITPKPKGSNGEVSATPTRTPSPRDGLKPPHTSASPRRRSSLSALPDTPPPFARYFEPETLLSPVSPIVPHQRQSRNTPRPPRSPLATSSPPTPSASSASPQTPVAQEDPGAIFRERRLRAAKLARFFGVGHGDLFPVTTAVDEDARHSSGSFDTVRSVHRESDEKEKEKLAGAAGVSVTVQREVDAGRPSSSSSSSSNTSVSASPDLKKVSTMTTTTDWDGGAAGCYGSLSFGTGLTPSRSASTRRRRGFGVGAGAGARQSGVGFGVGVLAGFSLGRQSRGTGVNGVVRNSVSVSPGRKGSERSTATATTKAGVRALTFGDRTSFGLGDLPAGETAMRLGGGLGKSEREPARVRVGQKAADVHEVMGKLRELR